MPFASAEPVGSPPWIWNCATRSPSSPARARASAWLWSVSSRRRAPSSSPAPAAPRPSTGWTASRRSPSISSIPTGRAASSPSAIDLHGRVDVLVNNVGGVHPRVDGFLSITDAGLRGVDAAQLLRCAAGHAGRGCRHARTRRGDHRQRRLGQRVLRARRRGRRLRRGQGGAAQRRKALSQELGPKGIRINSVSPGPVATDLWLGDDGVAATIGARDRRRRRRHPRRRPSPGIPTGRFSTPEEVATLVALLASPRTANVTGSDYVIDGGLIKTM